MPEVKVTIQNTSPSHVDGPIYSAGGKLTVEGKEGIEVKKGGFLAAPMGSIILTTDLDGNPQASGKRIYLAEGSVLTTAGNTNVNYGSLDANNIWITMDKKAPDYDDSSEFFDEGKIPGKSITLDAGEVIVMGGDKGAVIDVSGGGSVFAYKFQPGVEGSVDPLGKTGRFVVFKDNYFQMPGTAVYLKGGGGLSEGMYTMLPLDANNTQNARYAFMPGAYILEAQTGAALPGQRSLSKDRYPLAVGYSAVAGTSILGTRPQVYSVRTAADVLTEGHYEKHSMIGGNAGDITIKGNTAIMDGDLKAAAFNNKYHGGKVTLSGTDIIVQSAKDPLREFNFDTKFDSRDDLRERIGKLTVSVDDLSGKGISEISMGDPTNTKDITINSGTVLEAPVITLGATDNITIREGAQLIASTTKDKDSGEGIINLNTPAGSLVVEPGSILHAANEISLDVNNVESILGKLEGSFQVDNSAIKLKSSAIFFGTELTRDGSAGLYLTNELWDMFSNQFDNITLAGSGIQFRGSFSLAADKSITLDAASYTNMNGETIMTPTSDFPVTLTAPTVNLRNSGYASTALPATNSGTFAVNAANRINVGSGDVLFGGFKTIALNSKGDVTFIGKGTLTTGNADLDINAARVTTSADKKADGTYQAANFRVTAGVSKNDLNPANHIRMMKPDNGQAGSSDVPGGTLEFAARKIELATILQVDGGDIMLTAAGANDPADTDGRKFLAATLDEDGIILHDGGKILATGTADAPGGRVTLATDFIDDTGKLQSGKIELKNGSLINVSAGAQGDAGIVTLQAPIGGVEILGDLKGTAGIKKDNSIGRGGSFVLDTNLIKDFCRAQ